MSSAVDSVPNALHALDAEPTTFEMEGDAPRAAMKLGSSAPNGGRRGAGERRPSVEGSWQRQVFNLLEDPESSPMAKVIGGVIMSLIFFGSISFVVETLPSVRDSESAKKLTDALEIVCIVTFTLDYLGRVITCTHRPGDHGFLAYLARPMNVIDLVSIAPFYLEKLLGSGGSLAILRMLRMARVFRILKVGSMSEELQVFGKGITRAAPGLSLLAFLLIIYLVVFASFLNMVEGGVNDGFSSIPETFWYVLSTLTTVGYGDVFPSTTSGKLIGSLCMMCGVLVLALPIVLVGTAFQDVFTEAEAEKILELRAEQQGFEEDSAHMAEEKAKAAANKRAAVALMHSLYEQSMDDKYRHCWEILEH